jgi:tetratricopeptide (TPR) repeat protein
MPEACTELPPPATSHEGGQKVGGDRSAPQYLRAKRKAKRLYLIAKGMFRSALSLTGWIVGLGVLVLLFREVTTDQTVIQPISVAKSLEDDGLTPEVAARRLQDAMNAVLFEASTSGGREVKVSFGKDLPEIVVPTVGMSLSTLANYVRMFLDLPSRTLISGEIVVSEKKASLVLRLNGREIYRSPEPIPLDRLDKMWSAAADKLLQHISPYHVALSAYETNPDGAVDIANYLIRYYPATDENVAWAHVILGMHHSDYLRYTKAGGEFEDALTIAARSRWPPLSWLPLSVRVHRVPSYASVAHVKLGSMLLDQGEFKTAIDVLNQAVSMDLTDGAARHYLGMARRWLDPEDAVRDFDEANRLLRKAIHDYDRRGGAENGKALLHIMVGNALQQQGREGAEVEFNYAKQLNPSDPRAVAAYCMQLYEKRTFATEYDFCVSSLRRVTGDADSQITLTNYLVERGKRAEAIDVLLNALKHDHRRPQLHAALGNLYAETKEWNQAVLKLSKAIELAPEAAFNHNSLGNVYYMKGEFPKAAQIYSTAIEYNPNNAQYHANRGAALKAQGLLAAAELEYQEASKLAGRSATEHNYLGLALYDKEDFANAAEAYRKAIAIEPRNALYHANLADALARNKADRPRDQGGRDQGSDQGI